MNNYYDNKAKQFFEATVDVDMSSMYEEFLSLIPKGSSILDAGCGSGRDAFSFQRLGFDVTAMDASKELCGLASQLLNQEVHCLKFEDIEWVNNFDGIWACASLLHVERSALPDVFRQLSASLKKKGAIYASFKYGSSSRSVDGRDFTDMNETLVHELMKQVPQLRLIKSWVTSDQRQNRSDSWLNIIISKSS
jgi:SAM-dependent methyltransferase